MLSFTDISAAAGFGIGPSGLHGAFFADATGDGLPDLYLTYNDFNSGNRANRFFRNVGGSFVEEAAGRGIANPSGGTHGAAWVDLDNDGDFDLLNGVTYAAAGVANPTPNKVFRNDGGFFADVTPAAMSAYADFTRGIIGADVDGNGALDIIAVNGDRGTNELVPDRNELYLNQGALQFSAVTSGAVVSAPAGQGAIATDYDGDGDIDLLMANALGPLNVLRNDGGTFVQIAPSAIGIAHMASSGITSADLNNDGHLDLILVTHNVSQIHTRAVALYYNNGNGTFTYGGGGQGFGGFMVGVADLDNDGDLDLVPPGANVVFLNDGAGGFAAGPAFSGPQTGVPPDPRSVAFADVDGDGDLDFVVTAKFAQPQLFRNNFNAGNWLKVSLVSPQGQAGAFGAKVRVFRAGTATLLGMREANSGYVYLAQDDPVLHFGLGSDTTVDVTVTFGDSTQVTRASVSANQVLTIGGSGSIDPPGAPQGLSQSVSGSLVTLNWNAPISGGAPATYVVEAGSAPGLSDLVVVSTGNTNRTFLANAPNGVYYVRVRARNAGGTSAPSNEVVVSVGGCSPPTAPGTLSYGVAGSLVTLNWSAPAGGSAPSSYLVEAGSGPGASNLVIFDTGSAAPALQVNAPAGTYFVRIRARNACGVGPASNEVMIQVA